MGDTCKTAEQRGKTSIGALVMAQAQWVIIQLAHQGGKGCIHLVVNAVALPFQSSTQHYYDVYLDWHAKTCAQVSNTESAGNG